MPRDRKPKFFYGYIIVLAAIAIQVVGWGMYSAYGVFFLPLVREFDWSRATIAGASSLALFLFGLMGIIAGGLNDRFGPRIVMATCGFFLGLGVVLMSQVNAIWQLYLFYGVMVGIGMSALDVVLLSTIARWFVKKRGTMSGIAKIGTGLGILIMPLVASGLISAYDWRTSCVILGTVALVFIIPMAQLLRRDPAQMWQLPDGEEQVDASRSNLAEVGLSIRGATRTRQFWVICVAYFVINLCAQTFVVHIVPYADDLGIPAMKAAGVLSILGGVSIVGRLVMGYAGDRIGNKWAMIICFLILVAALSWLQFSRELWMLYSFSAVYGFCHGGFFALISPMVAGLFGTRSHGVIFGTVSFAGMIGGTIGPILAGLTFDMIGSYQTAFLMLLAPAIIGLILAFLLKPPSEVVTTSLSST